MGELNGATRRIAALFRERLHIEVPSPDTDLIESGLLDSMQLVELLLGIEEQFGVRVSIEELDLDDLRTLARIARLVERRAARPAAVQSGG